MKIKFESSYWPNAVGFIGFMFAITFMVRSCNDLHVEKEKTKQIEILKQIKNK